MNRAFVWGVIAAVFATFSWALNFISPYVMGDYSAYDFISLRFLFSGVVGLGFLYVYRAELVGLSLKHFVVATGLGFMGYVAYIGFVMGGVIYGGPVITPAFLGAVPILLALVGNATRKTLAWSSLKWPLLLVALGIGLTNYSALSGEAAVGGASFTLGVICSIGAVLMWVGFSTCNQLALEKMPNLHMGVWTGLMMVGAAVGILVIIPFGLWFGIYKAPAITFNWANSGSVIVWALALGCVASVGGAWAWNMASQRLPMVLTGQLISIETLFATLFGLMAQQRFPTVWEAVGVTLLMLGAIYAVRLTAGASTLGAAEKLSGSEQVRGCA